MSEKVAFEATVKMNNIKSLVSGDKVGRLVLEYRILNRDLVGQIDNLHFADKEIYVVLMDGPK